jgi:peptide/nickel transport system permease protein
VLLIVGFVVFIILRLIPGDPAAVMLGPEATETQIAALREKLGLDRPIFQQLVNWYSNMFRGDLGDSLYYRQPALAVIAQRLEPTLLLMVMSLVISLAIGLPAGIIAALKRNTFIDRGLMIFAMLGISTPSFWLGLNLIILFSLSLGWFPATGYVPIADGGLFNAMWYLFLPAFSLGFQYAGEQARVIRSSMLDVLSSDYIRTARAKGLTEKSVILIHTLKNALIPTLTQIGMCIARLAGGAVVTETVFNVPGAGKLVISAINKRDYGLVQAHILLVAMVYVVVNLFVDLLYKVVDPRIEYK